jgi:hypothetical protein
MLKLWETKKGLPEGADYIALSHRWGDPEEKDKKLFCTTQENYERRLKGFGMDDLPKTFRDSVQVTRALGKHYLWIDALCITQTVQGAESSDWEVEAGRMEQVFGSAYCTIAATSAENWEEGFLAPEPLRDSIHDGGIRGILKHFQDYVDAGPLNQRAWVLQERVLSRRIIHFTKNGIYWTCGYGVAGKNSSLAR